MMRSNFTRSGLLRIQRVRNVQAAWMMFVIMEAVNTLRMALNVIVLSMVKTVATSKIGHTANSTTTKPNIPKLNGSLESNGFLQW